MATITRYINTASTAGGDGTTNATTGANRAYATRAEFEANEQQNLTTGGGDIMLVYCSGTSADTSALVVDGWTTNAGAYIKFIGDNDTGVFSTSYYRGQVARDNFSVAENYVHFENYQVYETATSGYDTFVFSGTGQSIWDNCIFHATHNATYQQYITCLKATGSSGEILGNNCVFYGWYGNNGGENSITQANDSGVGATITLYNCVLDAPKHCAYAVNAADTVVIRNSAINPGSDAVFGGSGTETIDYCGSTAGTGTNAYTITTWADEFDDSANYDYHIPSGSGLIDQGIGPSSDANVPTTDIDGNTRSGTTCDIGIHEYTAAPTGGRIMSSLVSAGGLAGAGGIAGMGGGLAG